MPISSVSPPVYPMADVAMALPLAQTSANSVIEKTERALRLPEENECAQQGFPPNFGEVVDGIYRCSFPQPWHLPSIQRLRLRSIITLVDEPYTADHETFLEVNGIKHFRVKVRPNKEHTIPTPQNAVNEILEILLNKANHPILIHCNKGKHRTGCVVACFRRLQGWKLDDVIDEYFKYAWPKARALDARYIEEFDPSKLANLAKTVGASSWQRTGKYKDLEPKAGDRLASTNWINTSF